jgi:putative transposase
LEQLMEMRRSEAQPEGYREIRRGWCWGEERFRKELLAQMRERLGPNHYGEERRESGEERAEAIIAAELPGRRWRGKVLDRLPKSDPRKVALALRLRAETTLSVAWIAGRLGLGTRQYATKLLYGARRQSEDVKS